MIKDKPYVYVILEVGTGKRYYGSTRNFKRRKADHIGMLMGGRHHSKSLQADFDNGGIFRIKPLKSFDTYEEAFQLESALVNRIIATGKLYNVAAGDSFKDTLTYNPNREDVISRRSKTLSETCAAMTPEQKAKRWDISGCKNPMYGRTHTDEVKERQRQRILGTTPPNKGKPMPQRQYEEMCKRMRDNAHLYRGERNHFYGRTHSDETKRRLREANLGRLNGTEIGVVINGVAYDSMQRAADALGICRGTVRHRVRSKNPRFSEWKIA
jgi:group I intron endonuclease